MLPGIGATAAAARTLASFTDTYTVATSRTTFTVPDGTTSLAIEC